MKIQLRERDRRAMIGLACALGAYFVLSTFVLPAFDNLKGSSGTVVEKEEELRKYRRAVIRKGHYTQLLEQARKNMNEAEARLIPGDNASLAAVELQRIVEDAAQKVMIPLSQRSVSTAKKKDAFFNEVTMTLSFECTPNQLTMFLSEIRNAPKFITVRNAQVAPVQVVQEAPKKSDFQKTVRANLTLAALLASPKPLPTPSQEKKG
jgi:hypothetical protein